MALEHEDQKAILKGIMDLLHLPLLLKSSKWWQTPSQFRALECIYLQTSWLCFLDAKQLNQLILAFPEWAGCVLFMKTESAECSRFSSVTCTFPDYFPAQSTHCVALSYLTKVATSGNNRLRFTHSQGTNMRIFNRTHCSFRAKSHLRWSTLPLWKSRGAESSSPQTLIWPSDSSHVLQQWRKEHLRWAGPLGSWTSAPYYLMRRYNTSHKIIPSICFTWWGQRKKETPSKTEYLKNAVSL